MNPPPPVLKHVKGLLKGLKDELFCCSIRREVWSVCDSETFSGASAQRTQVSLEETKTTTTLAGMITLKKL